MKKFDWKPYLLLGLPAVLATQGFLLFGVLGNFFTLGNQTVALAIGIVISGYAIFNLGAQRKAHHITLWLGVIFISYSGLVVYPNQERLVFRGKESTLTDSWFIVWPTDFLQHKIKMVTQDQTCWINISPKDSNGKIITTGHAYAKFPLNTDSDSFQDLINKSNNPEATLRIELSKWLKKISNSALQEPDVIKWLTEKNHIQGKNYLLTMYNTQQIVDVDLQEATEQWQELIAMSLKPEEGYVQLIFNQ